MVLVISTLLSLSSSGFTPGLIRKLNENIQPTRTRRFVDGVKGTADESVMLNYYNRTVEPILRAIAESMRTTFLSKTARTQLQSIEYYRDPFQLVPVSAIAEIADKFTRNEVLSSNEVRGLIGFKPVKDPAADELRNKNLPIQEEPTGTPPDPNPMSPPAEPNGREGRS